MESSACYHEARLKQESSQDQRTTQTTCRARTNTEVDRARNLRYSHKLGTVQNTYYRPLERIMSAMQHKSRSEHNSCSVETCINNIHMYHKHDVTILQQTCTQLHNYFQSSQFYQPYLHCSELSSLGQRSLITTIIPQEFEFAKSNNVFGQSSTICP